MSKDSQTSTAFTYFLLVFSAFLSSLTFAVLCTMVVLHAFSPRLLPVDWMSPLLYLLAGASSLAVASGAVHAWVKYPQHRRTLLVVTLITVGMFVVHLYTINSPATKDCFDSGRNVSGCVMDEVYYVPAAQTLLAGNKCAPYADNCNLEHPFLSKAFVAAGMAMFGGNVFGWRFFQVLLGTLSLPVLFGLCWTVTKNRSLSILATIFFAMDTLFFVHASIGVIDVHAVFFALLAFLLYFSGLRLWKLDSFVLAGVALGLSGLSKETSIFFVLFLLSYNLLVGPGGTRARVLSSVKILAAVAIVFVVGLQLYDSLFAPSQTFVDHLKFIFSYGGSLRGDGWIDSILHTPITPLNWFLYYSPIGYLVTTVTVNSGSTSSTYIGVGYYGVTNKIETWLTFLWAPYVIYLLYKVWRRKLSETELLDIGNDYKLAVFALLLLAWTFFPYLGLYLYGRVTYPYYMIQSVPAVAVGCAYFVTRRWFPKVMIYVLVSAVIGLFIVFYPDKDFLPTWIRVLLGR